MGRRRRIRERRMSGSGRFGSEYGNRRERRGGAKKTAAAVFGVCLLAVCFGVGAYFFSKNHLAERKRVVPAPVELQEEMDSEGAKGEEVMDQIRALFARTGMEPDSWEERVAVSRDSIEPEEIRVIWMEDFVETRTPVKVKGIYVTASRAERDIDSLIRLVDGTELNTMVIDIKDDDGRITFEMDQETALEIGAVRRYISDIDGLVKKLKEKGIYLIARIVAFKDPVLAEAKPDCALKNTDGTTFRDKDGQAWVNPYKKEVWDYLIEVAEGAREVGFDEVNFDYIRFSTDSGMKNVDFGEEAEEITKIETVTSFVKYACEQLRPSGLYISADVYGAIISSQVDAKIVGQSYANMSRYLDYICPMVYPSHYGDGYYGLAHPDLEPYQLVSKAMQDSEKALEEILPDEHRATVRPWLQDFTASWLKYHKKYGSGEVRDQINAVYDNGYEEWLLWNGAMNYTKDALLSE